MPDSLNLARVSAVLLLAFALPSVLPGAHQAQGCSTEHDPATRTRIGQQMPPITVTDTSGKPFSLADQRGKIVLINFWATWCGPCKLEIPRIEKEIWQVYKANPDFAMIAIAREQSTAAIAAFPKANGFTFPVASDPTRSTYKLFAESGIPRSYVVSPTGKILYQTVGYCPEDFNALKLAISQALIVAKPK